MHESGGSIPKWIKQVFLWVQGDAVIGMLASHVDDFIWSETSQFKATIINHNRAQLNVGKEDSQTFQYIGIDLYDGFNHQSNYANRLTFIQLIKARAMQKNSQLTRS